MADIYGVCQTVLQVLCYGTFVLDVGIMAAWPLEAVPAHQSRFVDDTVTDSDILASINLPSHTRRRGELRKPSTRMTLPIDVDESLAALAHSLCIDRRGNKIQPGEYFVPDDPCKTCVCHYGMASMCAARQCAMPWCSDDVLVKEDECCQIKCSSNDTPNGILAKANDTTTLGLRLLASGATSLLIFVVLLYIVHHLRNRRVLVALRSQYRSSREDGSSDVCRADCIDISVNHPPYDGEMPPPYSPPKPRRSPSNDAPPPYDEMMAAQGRAPSYSEIMAEQGRAQRALEETDDRTTSDNEQTAEHCDRDSTQDR